jgi:hypothetical protein
VSDDLQPGQVVWYRSMDENLPRLKGTVTRIPSHREDCSWVMLQNGSIALFYNGSLEKVLLTEQELMIHGRKKNR